MSSIPNKKNNNRNTPNPGGKKPQLLTPENSTNVKNHTRLASGSGKISPINRKDDERIVPNHSPFGPKTPISAIGKDGRRSSFSEQLAANISDRGTPGSSRPSSRGPSRRSSTTGVSPRGEMKSFSIIPPSAMQGDLIFPARVAPLSPLTEGHTRHSRAPFEAEEEMPASLDIIRTNVVHIPETSHRGEDDVYRSRIDPDEGTDGASDADEEPRHESPCPQCNIM